MRARELAIESAGLAKSFGALRVLKGIDLRVPIGSVYALLGPNGAGKIFKGALRHRRPDDEVGGRTSKSSPDSSVKATGLHEPMPTSFAIVRKDLA